MKNIEMSSRKMSSDKKMEKFFLNSFVLRQLPRWVTPLNNKKKYLFNGKFEKFDKKNN